MDCSPPDSSVHRILQARILEWVVCPNTHYPSATTATGFWQEQTLYRVTLPPGVNQDKRCSRTGLAHLPCRYQLGGRSPEGPASVLLLASEHLLWLENHSQVTQHKASKARKEAKTRKVRLLRERPSDFPFCFLSLHPANKRALPFG